MQFKKIDENNKKLPYRIRLTKQASKKSYQNEIASFHADFVFNRVR